MKLTRFGLVRFFLSSATSLGSRTTKGRQVPDSKRVVLALMKGGPLSEVKKMSVSSIRSRFRRFSNIMPKAWSSRLIAKSISQRGYLVTDTDKAELTFVILDELLSESWSVYKPFRNVDLVGCSLVRLDPRIEWSLIIGETTSTHVSMGIVRSYLVSIARHRYDWQSLLAYYQMKGLVFFLSFGQEVVHVIGILSGIPGLNVVVDCPWVNVLGTDVDLPNNTNLSAHLGAGAG